MLSTAFVVLRMLVNRKSCVLDQRWWVGIFCVPDGNSAHLGFGVLNNPSFSLSLGCLSSLLGSENDIHTYTSLLESQYISEGQHSFSVSLPPRLVDVHPVHRVLVPLMLLLLKRCAVLWGNWKWSFLAEPNSLLVSTTALRSQLYIRTVTVFTSLTGKQWFCIWTSPLFFVVIWKHNMNLLFYSMTYESKLICIWFGLLSTAISTQFRRSHTNLYWRLWSSWHVSIYRFSFPTLE